MAGIYAAAAMLIGTIFAVIVAAGFFFGTAVAVIGGAIGLTTLLNTSREIPRQFRTPGRDELRAALAGIVVIAATIAVALLTDGYAWVGVPIGGGALVWMLYAYSHPDYGVWKARPEPAVPVVTRASELRVGLVEMLRRADIFNGLHDSDLADLAELGTVRAVPEGEGLGAEGQVGASIYVVLDGAAHLSANSSIGRLTARMAGPGESFPLAALLGEGRLITTVKASTEMRVWQVDRGVLTEHLRTHCEIGAHVYEKAAAILAERYRSTIWRLTQATADAVKSEGFWVSV